MIAEAIQHAISGQSFEYAAHLIEQEIQTSENPRFDAMVLRHALDKLPVQLTDRRSWLLVAKAWVGFTSSQFAEAIASRGCHPVKGPSHILEVLSVVGI